MQQDPENSTFSANKQSNNLTQPQLFDLVHADSQDSNSKGGVHDSVRDQMLVSLLALSSAKGVGAKTIRTLFDSDLLLSIWHSEPHQLSVQLESLGKQGKELANLISKRKESMLEHGRKEAEQLRKRGIMFLPRGHHDYPDSLLRLEDPPPWIFIQGNSKVLQSQSIIAVVGTRNPSAEGEKLSFDASRELAIQNIIVLSGFAKGIDERAHYGAVKAFGQTIAILGHGMDAPYVSINLSLWSSILEAEGAIITEYLPSDVPNRDRFLRRNELQAAISSAVIPVEVPSMSSGTGATIRRAMRLRTPVIGLFPESTNEQSLVATKDNLLKLGYPVFAFSEKNSGEFWDYLHNLLATHDWAGASYMRQQRILRQLESKIIEAKLELDANAIDQFADQLKAHL